MANISKLEKVKDQETILSLLSSAKESQAEVYIWRFVGSSKYLAHVRIEAIRKLRGDFCIIPVDGQDRQVQELLGIQNHIDLYIPGSSLLLRCQIRQSDAPFRYYLKLPEFVAQVDRRQCPRINVFDKSEVKISFGKTTSGSKPISQHFLKDCNDISSGGFSFYVSRIESKFFQIHDPIRAIELKADGWTTKVNVEITLIKEIEPNEQNGLTYKVWRVCCRFTQIDQISKKYLEKFIFERIKEELHAINE